MKCLKTGGCQIIGQSIVEDGWLGDGWIVEVEDGLWDGGSVGGVGGWMVE